MAIALVFKQPTTGKSCVRMKGSILDQCYFGKILLIMSNLIQVLPTILAANYLMIEDMYITSTSFTAE